MAAIVQLRLHILRAVTVLALSHSILLALSRRSSGVLRRRGVLLTYLRSIVLLRSLRGCNELLRILRLCDGVLLA